MHDVSEEMKEGNHLNRGREAHAPLIIPSRLTRESRTNSLPLSHSVVDLSQEVFRLILCSEAGDEVSRSLFAQHGSQQTTLLQLISYGGCGRVAPHTASSAHVRQALISLCTRYAALIQTGRVLNKPHPLSTVSSLEQP